MTTSIKILTTNTLDSSPALLLCDPNGNRTLVNCGEGCQRSFLEANALRVKSVRRICLTHLDHTSVGGLPGLILTSADAVAAAAAEQQANVNGAMENAQKSRKPSSTANNHNLAGGSLSSLPDLEIVGPEQTQAFVRSLRHFMRRDQYKLKIIEGGYREEESSSRKQPAAGGKKKQKKRKRETPPPVDGGGFSVESIPFQRTVATGKHQTATPTQILSFVFQTAAIQGKFLIEKARELGIPKGHLYGQLKAGKSVSFKNEAGVQVTVESHQVVAPESPGSVVLVVYCPARPVLSQMKASPLSSRFSSEGSAQTKGNVQLDVMVHMTPRDLFESEEYHQWMSECFPTSTEHIWFDSGSRFQHPTLAGSTPFQAAAKGALKRNFLCPAIYKKISSKSSDEATDVVMTSNDDELRIRCAERMLEYLLIPRLRQGYVVDEEAESMRDWEKRMEEEGLVDCKESGAMEMASKITEPAASSGDAFEQAELCFTGTGSALPCKHRNVSGILLRASREGDGMLLDVGEGTMGQLYRMQPDFDVTKIHAVWISHPHADHHLGVVRLLSERQRSEEGASRPLLLLAPPNLFRFLEEYARVDPTIRHSYVQVDCSSMVSPRTLSPSIQAELQDRLGVTKCTAIPVAHCPHAYAVIVDGTKFGRVAYSGDCRPSDRFAQEAQNTDVLIHEATFEDGMEAEATLKRHSTVGEALTMGKKMKAKSIILTHFSQRYPKIPPLPECDDHVDGNGSNVPVAVAFDFMCVTPTNLRTASLLTPALRLLYPDEEKDPNSAPECQSSSDVVDAKVVLDVPGVFAQPGII